VWTNHSLQLPLGHVVLEDCSCSGYRLDCYLSSQCSGGRSTTKSTHTSPSMNSCTFRLTAATSCRSDPVTDTAMITDTAMTTDACVTVISAVLTSVDHVLLRSCSQSWSRPRSFAPHPVLSVRSLGAVTLQTSALTGNGFDFLSPLAQVKDYSPLRCEVDSEHGNMMAVMSPLEFWIYPPDGAPDCTEMF
jgi:hypothetical protein